MRNAKLLTDRCRHPAKDKGSALTETVILCIVMVPLTFMLPIIGKLIDLKQTTIQASRYAAWQQTVTTGNTAPADIRARFYQDPAVQLHTHQVEQGDKSARNILWGSAPTTTEKNGTVNVGSDISISFSDGAGHSLENNIGDNGVAKRMGEALQITGGTLDFMGSVEWDIEGDGMLNAGVQVNVKANQYLANGGSSCISAVSDVHFACVSAHNAIMIDGWDSASNSQAENRTRAFVPGVVLEEVGASLSQLGNIPTFKELKGLKGAFGHVDSTQLPLDRYTGTYQKAE